MIAGRRRGEDCPPLDDGTSLPCYFYKKKPHAFGKDPRFELSAEYTGLVNDGGWKGAGRPYTAQRVHWIRRARAGPHGATALL